MGSLEDKIASDNSVRFIDAFVSVIDLKKIGFTAKVLKTEGRPSYRTEVFLKLFYMDISTAFTVLENSKKSVFATSKCNGF